MCLFKYFINNPVPTIQAQFPQFRVIELFASKAATNAVIMGHSSNDFRFLLTVLQSVNIVIFGFGKLINARDDGTGCIAGALPSLTFRRGGNGATSALTYQYHK